MVLRVNAKGEEGPGKYVTIQNAVNNAVPGDTIIIHPGEYHEGGCLVITKSLNIIRDPSPELQDEQVVLNASLVFFGDTGRIEGITIRYIPGGNPATDPGSATSPRVDSKERWLEVRGTSEVVIENCTVTGSVIVSDRSNPRVIHNTIKQASRHGLLIEGRSRGIFERNTIQNSSNAGVVVRGEAEPVIRENKISSNRREGVQIKGNSKAIVEGNTITNNLVGISVRQLGAPTVLKNSIQSNVRAGVTVAPTCPISDLTDNDVAHNGEGEITPRGSDSDSDSDEDNIEIFTPKTPYSFGGMAGMPPRRGSTGADILEMKGGGGSSGGLDTLDESPPTFPMSGKQALARFPDKLTDVEKEEIVQFSIVYFLGEKHNKPDLTSPEADTAHNGGFDDGSGNYKLFPNDQISFRYEIVSMLGSGSFGQVVKCIDHKNGGEVAIKVICNEERRAAQAAIECQILEYLQRAIPQEAKKMKDEESWNIVEYKGHFSHRSHLCIVFPLLGASLYDLAAKGMELPQIQSICAQLVRGLTMLQRLRLIHCDLKPDNILMRPTEDGSIDRIDLIDFGTSCFEGGELYMYVQTRYYRSPCVILGIPYDCGVDMWSLGCVLAELHMGRPLFPGDNDVDQLARIMEILGPPPMHVVERSQKRNIFFEGETNRPRIVPNLHGKRRRPGTRSLKNLVQTKDEVFLSFLEGCLCWDPNKRLTPETAVNHEFVANLKKPG